MHRPNVAGSRDNGRIFWVLFFPSDLVFDTVTTCKATKMFNLFLVPFCNTNGPKSITNSIKLPYLNPAS